MQREKKSMRNPIKNCSQKGNGDPASEILGSQDSDAATDDSVDHEAQEIAPRKAVEAQKISDKAERKKARADRRAEKAAKKAT